MITIYGVSLLRALRRRLGWTALNVLGLAVGMASCLLIAVFVQHEWSYDTFHPHADRIVRVVQTTDDGGLAWVGDGMARTIRATLPQAEAVVEVMPGTVTLAVDDVEAGARRQFEENRFLYATDNLFDVFGFDLVRGNPATALREPNAVVLTASTARRYFGDTDPMGRTMRLDADRDVTVTGIVADPPSTSHLAFDVLASFGTFFVSVGRPADFESTSFWWPNNRVYVRLREGTDRAAFVQTLRDEVAQRRRAEVVARFTPTLQPITSIHLHSDLSGELQPGGSAARVWLFVAIAGMILLLGCVNFVNLATARATERAQEVGVRKSLGAGRRHLVGQFLGEALLTSGVAGLCALVLTRGLLPVFATLIGRDLDVGLASPLLWGGVVVVVLVVGLGAGSYPAFVLARFDPTQALRDVRADGQRRGHRLRQGLVVGQFAVSFVLIVVTTVAFQQLHYLRTAELGFDDEQVVAVDVEGDTWTFAEAVRQQADVRQVTFTNARPGVDRGGDYRFDHNADASDDGEQRIHLQHVGTQFFEMMAVPRLAGRTFADDRPADRGVAQPSDDVHFSTWWTDRAFVINRAAAATFGWTPEAAIGKPIRLYSVEGETVYQDQRGTVVGVVETYHTQSLHAPTLPTVYAPALRPGVDGSTALVASHVLVKVAPDAADAVLARLEDVWTQVNPDAVFQASFLDDRIDAQYRTEYRIGRLVGGFAGLAVFVACLGLFGLAAFTAQQRRREIGIRKALGATVESVVRLLSKDFLQLVVVAIVLAAPVAYLVAMQWLSDFAYRIGLGVGPFAISAVAALVTALVAVASQALRAATVAPAHVLRSE